MGTKQFNKTIQNTNQCHLPPLASLIGDGVEIQRCFLNVVCSKSALPHLLYPPVQVLDLGI